MPATNDSGKAPAPMTSPGRVLAALWPFALLFCLYSATDVHAWLAWDEGSTRLERRIGRAVLAAGRASGLVAARDALEAGLEPWREPPRLLARSVEPADATPATGTALGLPDPPRRILVAGASSIEFHFGVALERCLETYAGVEVRRVGKLGTGLARPQDFDWLAGLPKEQAAFSPDLVVGQFGGNDCRPAIDPASGRRWQFDTPEWRQEYGRRVSALVRGVVEGGARMELLGQLAVRRPGNRRCFETVDAATREAAEQAGASFLPLRALTLRAGGGGEEEVIESITDASGVVRRMWIRDDLHLTRAGATAVAARICPLLERRHGLESPDPAKGRVLRFETASAARGGSVEWYAILPREIPAGGVPALYLLHGGGGSAEDWMTEQESLQRMAVTHGIAVIVPDGGAWSWWIDGLPENSGVESFVIRELIPDAARRLPLNGRRGIAGLSMGGHGALVLAARNPGAFVSASSMSGVVDLLADPTRTGQADALGALPENGARWRERSAQQLLESRPRDFARLALKLSCGDRDRFLGVNRAFHAALEERGIAHEWDETPGGHEWSYWAATLPAHVAWHAERLRAAR